MGVFCEAHVLTCNVNGLRRQNWIDVDMEREDNLYTVTQLSIFKQNTDISCHMWNCLTKISNTKLKNLCPTIIGEREVQE